MIYLDANVIIRLIEGLPSIRQPLEQRLSPLRSASTPIITTSRLGLLECRCKPLKTGDTALLGIYDAFFAAADRRAGN